jgi:hypothetical protein
LVLISTLSSPGNVIHSADGVDVERYKIGWIIEQEGHDSKDDFYNNLKFAIDQCMNSYRYSMEDEHANNDIPQ